MSNVEKMKVDALTDSVYERLEKEYKKQRKAVRERIQKSFDSQFKLDEQYFKEKLDEMTSAWNDIRLRVEKVSGEKAPEYGRIDFNLPSVSGLQSNILTKLVNAEMKRLKLTQPNRQQIRREVIIKMMDTQSSQTIIDHVTNIYK